MESPSQSYSASQQQQPNQPQYVERPPAPPPNPNQMSGGQGAPQSGNQFNYWLAVQDYQSEIAFIKGLLEGKGQTFHNDGTMTWEYPTVWRPMPTEENPLDGKWVSAIEPVCTPQGQREILSWIAVRLQPGTVLSNMSAQRMLYITEQDLYTIWRMMFLNMDLWQIDPTRFEALIMTLGDRVEQARRRSVDNEERGIVGKVVSVFQSISGNQQKPGLPSISGLYSNPGKSKF